MSINANNITDIDDSTLLKTGNHRNLVTFTMQTRQSKLKNFFQRNTNLTFAPKN